MRIKKINVWDDSQNRGYGHAVIEIKTEDIPDNYQALFFAVQRPGYAESHMINNPKGDVENPWSGSENEKTRLEPEGYIERDGNSIFIRVGEGIVRHMDRGNYTFRLMDPTGNAVAKKVMVWDVKVPVKPLGLPSIGAEEPASPPPDALGTLKKRLEQAALEEDKIQFESVLKEIFTLSPDDNEAIQIRENFYVQLEEKHLKELMINAGKALEEDNPDLAESILDNIDSIRAEYPPANNLREKIKSKDDPNLIEDTYVTKETEQSKQIDPPEPKGPMKKIIAGCIILAVLAGGGSFLYNKFSGTSREQGTHDESVSSEEQSDQRLAQSETTLEKCKNKSLTAEQCYAEGKKLLEQAETNPDTDLVAMAGKIFEIPANEGHAEANRQLGIFYDPAKTLIADRQTQRAAKPALAYDYYKKAAEKGSEQACEDLKQLHSWLNANAGSDSTLTLLLKLKNWNLAACRR